MSSRETVIAALFARLISGDDFKTTGRRVRHWSDVSDQPALFVRHTGEIVAPRVTRMPAKTVIECDVVIYSRAGKDPAVAPDTELNRLLGVVDALLRPPPAFDAQTLGGIVEHCWIEGDVTLYAGDIGDQAIAVVPVKLLAPIIS